MLKAYKYRLYPNKTQAEKINQSIGVCRLVYNLALDVKITAYKSAGVNLTAYDIQKQLIELKVAYPWMGEVSRRSLDDSIARIDVAFKNFFRGQGFPVFKRRKSGGSFQCSGDKRKIDWQNATLSIPKIYNIPIVLSRPFSGQIRTVTIRRTPTGKYFATILVKTEEKDNPLLEKKNAIGIDLGISHFAALSTGRKIDNPKFLRSSIERLKILQYRASKKKKGSKNHKKALRKVAVVHERIFNRRNDFLHKLSTELIRDNQTDTICVESLAVSNMVQNKNLSQAISDAGWYEFVRQLEYKAKWHAKNLIKVDRFFASSKTCSACGQKADNLPLSVREWICQCGAIHDRDINAAINIRNSGMDSPGVPVEQSALMGCYEAGKSFDRCQRKA